MIPAADPTDLATAHAARELDHLSGQVAAMRSVLIRLLQDVVAAEKRLTGSEAAQLLEANEQLVIAAMQSQVEAETAAQALDEISRSAELDALTQLPNRVLLLDRFASAIANARRHGTRLGVLFLDIDNFKSINDNFGHAVGDEALKRVAACLSSSVRAVDTVSRHGGDEFLVLLTDVSQAPDAIRVADKVLGLLGAAEPVGNAGPRISVSIGISLYPDDGADPIALIELADAAMYRAKRHAPGSCVLHGHAPLGVRQPQVPARESRRRLRPGATSWANGAANGAVNGAENRTAIRPVNGVANGADADAELLHARLREANEQLVLAALGAQELQAAAETAQRRQTEFLAVVAHELSNPLAPIRIAAAHLGRSRSDELLLPRARELIERQEEHMSRLVSELLDVSRAQPAALRLERQPTDLTGVVHRALDACRPDTQTRHQRLDVRMPAAGSAPAAWVDGDPLRLAQVFSNLLDNASKYTPDAGEIALAMDVEGGSAVIVITVTDNGIGITPAALAGIFDPFMQDTHAFGFNGIGVGIGLTVVKALVEAHGGTVAASSAGRGLGSRFIVTLPLTDAPRASNIPDA